MITSITTNYLLVVKSIQMVKRKYPIIVMAVSLTIFSVATVFAQTAPKAPPAGSSHEQRLEQRKKERAIVLEDVDARRLEQRCKGAQTNLIAIQQEVTTVADARRKKYDTIDAKLWVTIGQLKLAGADTFDLQKYQTEYLKQVAAFNTLTKDYLQTLDDTVVINCEADPVGFKALLETNRLYLKQIREQSEVIRLYLVDTVKPEISKLGEGL